MTRRRSRPVRPLLLLAVVGLLVGTTGAVAAGRNASGTPAPDAHPVLLAAGDIATCDGNGDEATAQLLDRLAGTVAVLGDGAYPNGTATDYAACYDPTWGRHKARTRPTPGNHDYDTAGAAGTSAISAPRPATPPRATTPTLSAPGTSWSSTATAPP